MVCPSGACRPGSPSPNMRFCFGKFRTRNRKILSLNAPEVGGGRSVRPSKQEMQNVKAVVVVAFASPPMRSTGHSDVDGAIVCPTQSKNSRYSPDGPSW
jgi:hypothetical protein